MNGLDLINSSCCYLEFRPGSLQALRGDHGLDLALERQPDGRLTPACRERITLRLQAFLKRAPWQPRPRVFCAIPARGVSLRRLTLPAASKDELTRLLLLQIENEFPLAPHELAWGYCRLNAAEPRPGTRNGKLELLVGAVRKQALEDYTAILSACGASPVFTLAALARSQVCARPPAAYAVLDIGERSSELATFDQGAPAAIRVLPWGRLDLARSSGPILAEPLLPGSNRPPVARVDTHDGPRTALASLVNSLTGQLTGCKIYVTSTMAGNPELISQLAEALRANLECEPVTLAPGEGRSAAILGLRQAIERDHAWPSLVFQAKPTNGLAGRSHPAPLRWAALAVALALVALALPYAEAVLLKPRLAGKLAATKAEKGKLATVDRELDFLQYLKQNQPPYLDALFLLAKSAPPGARFDSLSMSRRGEFSLRGSMKDAQEVADFRAKLIGSGSFTNVAVEEQNPTPDRRKLVVRMTAQWQAAAGRAALAAALAREAEKPKATVKAPPTNAPSAAGANAPAAPSRPTPRKEPSS